MEETDVKQGFWLGRKVFVTGHTGFKGGWLSTWLEDLGAKVTGFALPPEFERSFFTLCGVAERIHSVIGDVRDQAGLQQAVTTAEPEIIFHLAAQALVRRSYRDPIATLATNVMGTAHILEIARHCPSVKAVLIVTSDKCYENQEWLWSYRENDRLGGKDPYSTSKACAELTAAAFRDSFFESRERPVGIATVRAGNVIGGGDWSEDRLVPDAVRALERSQTIAIRNPTAIRPWQHVLEPLAGYLQLAERLADNPLNWVGAWNFGPDESGEIDVGSLATRMVRCWGSGSWEILSNRHEPHEANCLKLDSSKAAQTLGWRPRLNLDEAIEMTVAWYRAAISATLNGEMYELTTEQIAHYEAKGQGDYAKRKEMSRL